MEDVVKRYLMIETKSYLESPLAEDFLTTALGLASNGRDVTFLLIQDAVTMAVNDSTTLFERDVSESRVRLLVDNFSLQSRSLCGEQIVPHAQVVGMSEVVELMASANCKTIWHS